MKILDASSLIAFLWDLKWPDGIVRISARHEIVIPSGVASEVTRESAKAFLRDLIQNQVVRVVLCSPERVGTIRDENPQLGKGECEVLAFAETLTTAQRAYLVSDDKKARSKFPQYRWVWTEELLAYMRERALITQSDHRDLIGRLEASSFFSRSKRHGS